MKKVKLIDVCGPKQWPTISTEQLLTHGYPVYGANGKIGYFSTYNHEIPTLLITCRGATCGNINISEAKSYVNGNAMCLDNLCDNVDLKYLYYQLVNYDFANVISGSAQPQITREGLAKVWITLCPIEEQKEIADRLDKISDMIAKRKEQLSKLDQLVKSRFIEMFGNLVIGDKINENKHKIGEIASVTKLAGFEFTKYIQYKEQGDIIMLRGLNCKKGHLVLDDIKWIDKETSDLLPRSKLYYGDILMTYAGTIGDVAMVDADNKYHLAPNVAKITLTDKKAYNPVFLIHLFMYTNDYIMTFASVVAQASINMEKIRNFEYYFPSAEQQHKFATFVEQVDKSKFEIQQSIDKLETLKKSLMQQYFG